jgi:uncharacterized protein YbaR (Trm112 family)
VLILVTDLLACPRCGPEFGVVALADRMEERRVIAGRLGCANCREAYPIRDGIADLRPPGSSDPEAEGRAPSDPESAVRLAALMGLADFAGMALVAGPGAGHAAAIATLVPEVEVIAVDTHPGGEMARGVTRLVAPAGRLPLRGGLLRAAALTGGAGDAPTLHEGLRVLAPGGRLVVDPAPEGAAAVLRAAGATLLLDDGNAAVALAPGRPVELLRNAVR